MNILYLTILISFFKPDYFSGIGSRINILFSLLNILSIFLIFCIYFKKVLNEKKISKIILILVVYCLICILSTFINDVNNLKSVTFYLIKLFSLCLIFDYAIKYDTKKFLKISYILFEIMVLINFITMLLYPNGMWISPITGYWQNWFLGYDNNHITIFLPTLILAYLYDKIYNKKLTINFLFILLIINLSVFMSWSATSVVAIVLFDIYLIFNKKIRKILKNIYVLFCFYIGLFFSIVILKVQNLFTFLIVDILKKDLTFSGRIYIWDYIKKFIMKKPILGYGIQDSYTRYNITSMWKSYHAHNFILEILYRGGILLLICVFYIFYLVFKALHDSKNDLKFFGIFIIFLYLIMLLTEFYEPINYFYVLVLFNNINFLKGVE